METTVKLLLILAVLGAGGFVFWWYRRGERIRELEKSLKVAHTDTQVAATQEKARLTQEESNVRTQEYDSLRARYADLLKRLGIRR